MARFAARKLSAYTPTGLSTVTVDHAFLRVLGAELALLAAGHAEVRHRGAPWVAARSAHRFPSARVSVPPPVLPGPAY